MDDWDQETLEKAIARACGARRTGKQAPELLLRSWLQPLPPVAAMQALWVLLPLATRMPQALPLMVQEGPGTAPWRT